MPTSQKEQKTFEIATQKRMLIGYESGEVMTESNIV